MDRQKRVLREITRGNITETNKNRGVPVHCLCGPYDPTPEHDPGRDLQTLPTSVSRPVGTSRSHTRWDVS